MNSITIQIFSQLLETIKNDYSKDKKIGDSSMSMLSFLFEGTALQALELIDRQCITLIKTPNGRELYQIHRGTTDFHICLKNSNYCSCTAFFFQVLKKGQYMCKHKLATVLCSIMGLCKDLQYSDETISLMLAGEKSLQHLPWYVPVFAPEEDSTVFAIETCRGNFIDYQVSREMDFFQLKPPCKKGYIDVSMFKIPWLTTRVATE